MKKQALVLLLACLSLTGFAQEESRQKRTRLPHIEYRHDFRVGVGVPTPEFQRHSIGTCSNTATPNIYFFYGYRVIKGFKVTATVSYQNLFGQRLESIAPPTRGSSSDLDPYYAGGYGRNHHIRISPAVHYEWYNRGIVTMYSDMGVTFDISVKRDDFLNGVEVNRGTRLYFRPNVTPFGITVGKKWFGFAELFSFGPRGLFNAGAGYRF